MEGDIQERIDTREMTQQSLLKALSRFVHAVDAMDDAVMIPSKLRDMEVLKNSNDDVVREVNNNNSYNSYNNNNSKALLPSLPVGADMYSFYSMLNAVKSEIITGPSSEESDDNGESTDDSAINVKKTAQAFRHHLCGLFDVLHQMTETAKYLKGRQQQQRPLDY